MELAEKQGQMHTTEQAHSSAWACGKGLILQAAEKGFSSEGSLLRQGVTSNLLNLKRKTGRRKARVGESLTIISGRGFIAIYP